MAPGETSGVSGIECTTTVVPSSPQPPVSTATVVAASATPRFSPAKVIQQSRRTLSRSTGGSAPYESRMGQRNRIFV